MTNMKKRSAAALMAVILAIALTIPAAATAALAESIHISSYKGNTLEVRERSGLIISPSGTDYFVASSAPDTIAVEQVLTFWVAIAKAEGSAEITASSSTGECGRHDTDGQLHDTYYPENFFLRGQRRPDRQPGNTAGDNPAHQSDRQGQWCAGVASQ